MRKGVYIMQTNCPFHFGLWNIIWINTGLNESYGKLRIGENLHDPFPILYGLKHGDALPPLLFNFALEYSNRKDWN
jgi:hypothetical protein